MKKTWCVLLLVVLFASALLPLTAQAAGKDLIIDDMVKISEQGLSDLNAYAREIGSAYQMDVAFFLVSNSYSSGQSLREHVGERYLNTQGLGPDGFALAHDIEGRLWSLVSFGKAEQLMTDELEDWLWDAYDEGETYYDGVRAYLERANSLLANQTAGNEPNPPGGVDKPAVNVDRSFFAPRGDNYVLDETGTLTDAQIDDLNEKAAELSEKRKCGVYIWIVDLVPEANARTVDDLEAYVDVFYEKYDLGYGDKKNGIVLLLEIGDIPGERDYLFYTYGPCKSVFSNDTRERILDDEIVPLFKSAFSNGNFYKVADVFLDQVDSEFATDFIVTLVFKLIAVIFVPMLIALIVCSSWKRKMKTAKLASHADNYIPAGGFNLTGKSDTFLYRTTTRTRIERSSSSSGGGSSSSSSGRSSGGKA